MMHIHKVLICSLLLFLIVAPLTSGGTTTGRMTSVSVSPDGKVIAVTYEKGSTVFIYMVAINTGIAVRLTSAKTGAESTPSFSADGRQIAYSYSPGDGSRSRIVIGNSDGSGLHPWPPSEGDDFGPLFSPDNRSIVFSRSGYFGSYSPNAQPHSHDWNFYVAALDGTGVRQLTNDHFYAVSAPSISPDGLTMVFVNSEDHGDVIEFRSLEVPAKPKMSLRPHVPKEPRHDQLYNCPNYMPDGKSILFMAASGGKHGFDYDVYRLDLGTSAVESLTSRNGYATDLKVFADGKTAAFLKWRSDWQGTPVKSQLYLLDVQTHQVTPFNINGLD